MQNLRLCLDGDLPSMKYMIGALRLKKCQQENISEQLFELWKEVIDKTEFGQFEHLITDFLMKILRKPPGSFQTPLHMAAQNGEMALVWYILQAMDKEKIICQFDNFENNPIHEAARFGK